MYSPKLGAIRASVARKVKIWQMLDRRNPGMSPLRLYRLWSDAMRREGMWAPRHVLPLLAEAWRSRPLVSPPVWRQRMRACGRCPIYNRETRQCGRVDPAPDLGCGCSCPVKFLFRGETCWARENLIEGLGWPEEVQ